MAYIVTQSPVISVPQNQQVVTIRDTPQAPAKLGAEAKKGVNGLAITQIVMGVLCMIFEIALLVMYHEDEDDEKADYVDSPINGYVAPGIWNGVVIFVVGLIGFFAAKNNTLCLITTYMILNIVTCVLFIPSFISLTSIALDESRGCYYLWYTRVCTEGSNAAIALNALILVMAVSQFIMTIVAASLCCSPVCCRSSGGYVRQYNNPLQNQQQSMTVQLPGQAPITMSSGMNQQNMQGPYGMSQQYGGYNSQQMVMTQPMQGMQTMQPMQGMQAMQPPPYAYPTKQ